MRQIQLTRKAIKDLQRLQSTGAAQVPDQLLENLRKVQRGDRFPHTKHLKGYPHLWRSRLNLGGGSSLRLIWTEYPEDGSIRFLYADQRDNDTYQLNLGHLPQEPAYLWSGENRVEWSLFLTGQYQLSPILTQYQREISNEVGQDYQAKDQEVASRIGFFAKITQSPPGTGKTVAAVQRAYELYSAGWNVIFLMPQSLLEDFQEFNAIKSIESNDLFSGFFYGTFKNLLSKLFPNYSDLLLTPSEELDILQKLSQRAQKSSHNLDFEGIEPRDVILYQSFVLKTSNNTARNFIYQSNKERIVNLQKIKTDWWQDELSSLGKKSRSGCADYFSDCLEEQTPQPFNQDRKGNIIIIDEAQDYLLSELNLIIKLCRAWHQPQNPTYLWLLGDLNQRITPVDFNWSALELVKAEVLDWKCFRNSSHILRFSNLFLEPVKQYTHDNKTRYSYAPSDPEKSYEIGDPVKLICCSSAGEAETLLHRFIESTEAFSEGVEKSRSLIYKLANRAKILTYDSFSYKYKKNVEVLNVHEAKGREFDSCVIFTAFDFKGSQPIPEDWQKWYTLLLRSRSRLLVIVTQDQYKVLQQYIPDINSECEYIEFTDLESVEAAYQWIQEEGNDLELSSQSPELVQDYIRESLQLEKPQLHWDIYEVLDKVGIIGEQRTQFERELIYLLQQHPSLETELMQARKFVKNSLFHCLLLRVMHRSWDAISILENPNLIKPSDDEYRRVVLSICHDLEYQGLVVESARIKYQKLNIAYPDNFPMPEIAKSKGDIIAALAKTLKHRIFSRKLEGNHK